MKKILNILPLAALAIAMNQPASAQGTGATNTAGNEWQRNANTPAAVTGTHETRSSERKAKRAEVKAANKAGQLPDAGEDWGNAAPAALAGTHETRSAERKAKREEIKQAVRSGTLPVTTEAEVGKVPASAR